MRLINTSSLQLESFYSTPEIPYAILSHTWGQGEVTFEDIRDEEVRSKKPGWNKIAQLCRRAQSQGLQYAWIDTCCIDKQNSGELQEAINSMYAWYQQSRVCYAFLTGRQTAQMATKGMSQCRWFERGWTLQELLAPREVEFYDLLDEDVRLIGTRSSLCAEISSITGIQECYLNGKRDIEESSVAQRMSWASRRQTTRREDMVYCLLGLFDVSLSLFRGGADAIFQRLQEQIIAHSNDESIFAWTAKDDEPRGMLAAWPSEFEHSGRIQRNTHHRTRPPYTVTNRGLEFHNPARSLLGLGTRWMRESVSFGGMWQRERREHYLRLSCENEKGELISIKLAPDPETETYYRINPSSLYCHAPERYLQRMALLYGGYEKIYVQPPSPRRRRLEYVVDNIEPVPPHPRWRISSLIRHSLNTIFSFDNVLFFLFVECFSCLFLMTSILHRLFSLEPLYELNFFLGWAYLNFGWKVLGQNFYFWFGALALGLARPRPWSRGMAGVLLAPGMLSGVMWGYTKLRRKKRVWGSGDRRVQ